MGARGAKASSGLDLFFFFFFLIVGSHNFAVQTGEALGHGRRLHQFPH